MCIISMLGKEVLVLAVIAKKKSLGRPLPVVFLMTRVVTNYIHQSYPKPTKVDAFGQEIGSIVSALVMTREGLYARRMGVMTLQFSF